MSTGVIIRRSSYELKPGITYRPFRTFKIGITADFIDNTDDLQYVATTELFRRTDIYSGQLIRKPLGLP